MTEANAPEQEGIEAVIDKDAFWGFYRKTPEVEKIIDVPGIKLVRVRSGQKMVYWRFGQIAEKPKDDGLRLIVGLGGLYGSGMIVNTKEVKDQHILVETVQTKDNIELKEATASLFYKIEDPVKTAMAAFDDKAKELSYKEVINSIAEADLRQFIRGKTLEQINGIKHTEQNILSKDTEKYLIDELGIRADKLLYRRVNIPDELERSLAEAVIALQEARGRYELSKFEVKIAKNNGIAAKEYKENPEAITLRKLQTLDNLVESEGKHNLFIGLDPIMGSILANRTNQA